MKKVEYILIDIFSFVFLMCAIVLLVLAIDEDLIMIIPSLCCFALSILILYYRLSKTVFLKKYIFDEEELFVTYKNNETIINKNKLEFVICFYDRDKIKPKLLKIKFNFMGKRYTVSVDDSNRDEVFKFIEGVAIEKVKVNFFTVFLLDILEIFSHI